MGTVAVAEPPAVSFDTEEQVRGMAERILIVATGEQPLMPPQGGVPEDERYRLEVLLTCE